MVCHVVCTGVLWTKPLESDKARLDACVFGLCQFDFSVEWAKWVFWKCVVVSALDLIGIWRINRDVVSCRSRNEGSYSSPLNYPDVC